MPVKMGCYGYHVTCQSHSVAMEVYLSMSVIAAGGVQWICEDTQFWTVICGKVSVICAVQVGNILTFEFV